MVRAADSTGGPRPTVQNSPAQAASQQPGRTESIIAAGLTEATPPAATTPAKPSTPADSRSALPETITVKKGDSLSMIAARNQVSLEQLKAHNPELFLDGPDKSGKKRAVDGRLIYPGDTVKLRAPDAKPIDPARTTTASNKVVKAAKDYIDTASILAPDAAGGKGKEVSQRVVDSARKMLALIPASDPDRKTYEHKVEKILGEFLAQYPTTAPDVQRRFTDASNSFNLALRAYQDAKKVANVLPTEDIHAFQRDTAQRALDAFTEAHAAVRALPEGQDRVQAQEQLEMMEYALSQMSVPDDQVQAAKEKRTVLPADMPITDTSGPEEVAYNAPLRGAEGIIAAADVMAGGETGTQQAIGALPGAPAATPPATPAPVANAPVAQPIAQPPAGTQQPIGTIGQAQPAAYPPGYNPAVQPMPGYPVPGQPVAGYPVPGQPVAGYPVPGQPYVMGPNGQPMYPAGYAPAVQMPAAQPTGPRQYVPGPGEMAMFQAEDVKPTTPNYGNGGIERPNPTNGNNGTNGTNGNNGTNGTNGTNGNNGTNGTDGTNTDGRPQKDPNDPKVQQIWQYLKTGDHKAVRDLINNFDLFYASLPEQKALMIKILLDGRTNGEDQAAIASVVDMARQQGESDKMMPELDRLLGGAGQGIARMFEDLKKGARQQVLQALFGDPPRDVTFNPTYYTNLVASLDKKDIQYLCETLGTTPGSAWLNRIPNQAKQGMIDKLKSWWPFSGGLKRLREALASSMATTPAA